MVAVNVRPDGVLPDDSCKVYYEEFLKLVAYRMSRDRLESISVRSNIDKNGRPRLTLSVHEDSKYI